jgi:hypothetical protein
VVRLHRLATNCRFHTTGRGGDSAEFLIGGLRLEPAGLHYTTVPAGQTTLQGWTEEEILLISECSLEGEWEGQVSYLPLK